MLELVDVTAHYGPIQALFGMSFHLEEGQISTLIGRNGMGKTTTIKTIMGMIGSSSGQIRFCGKGLNGLRPFDIARRGIGLVPEGRQVFPNLTVHENLVATANTPIDEAADWSLQRVVDFFPQLAPRMKQMASTLSGGEQQMLAIGRALMTNPKLLILDEATEGLAPLIRQEIWLRLEELRNTGLTILLIDKNIDEFINIADYHLIIEKGEIVWQGDSDQLKSNQELKTRFLGV
jgi:branched-chain amino acid transport system ATP-binding protein